jgi:hypothetical protein
LPIYTGLSRAACELAIAEIKQAHPERALLAAFGSENRPERRFLTKAIVAR